MKQKVDEMKGVETKVDKMKDNIYTTAQHHQLLVVKLKRYLSKLTKWRVDETVSRQIDMAPIFSGCRV